jgi:membrane protein DedA with SNARE-associated domain
MITWIIDVVADMSVWGVALLMAIENVVLPMPSEVIMPLAGFLAGRGRMNLIAAIVAGAAGSAIGALPVYALGRSFGRERVNKWIDRHGRWLLLSGRDLQRSSERFERHGTGAVFFSQLLPGIRGLISLPAGFAKMNVFAFELWNFLGTLIWCAVLAGLGHVLGRNWERVHAYVGPASWILLGLVLGAGVVWFLRRRRRRAATRPSGA